ncbi:hypothetical protein JHK82_012565 [Glycine max]|nr:hypothetical protein JHK82_012565 [Glycine max]
MTKQKERRKESKLSRYMKAPLRFLKKARDMYVKGMIECSGQLSYVEASIGCPTGQLCTLPRSFSVGSATRSTTSDDDFKELVRAASLRSYGNRVQFGDAAAAAVKKMKMHRSRSVGIFGRIDEEKVCEFGDDGIKREGTPHLREEGFHLALEKHRSICYRKDHNVNTNGFE